MMTKASGRDGALPAAHRVIAARLRTATEALVTAMAEGQYSGDPRLNRFGDHPAQFRERLGTWIDLLIGAVEGRQGYRALFVTQTILEIHQPEREGAVNRAATATALDAIWREIVGAVGFGPAELAEFQTIFDDLARGMRTEPRAHVRTLLIGDCLMGEVAGLAADMLMRDAISFDTFPINCREPAQLERALANLAGQTYDAVFFSPFSHARLAEIEALLDPRRALQSPDPLVDAIIARTEPMLAYIAGRFECPIYIHNAGLVARATSRAKGWARNLPTAYRRGRARTRINRWLTGFLNARNATGVRQWHVVDEAEIVAQKGAAAGRYLYVSDFQHATRLSLALAHLYARRIRMLASLRGKKLVVCDLDHTLWDGVIGEGAVTHFAERQQLLRRLKQKSGVVLTIASKNDPEKVHFGGGVLDLEDFVAPQISWGRKVEAVARLRERLNLQYRHMVFVDDRPDERAFMTEAYPDMTVLDATEPETWECIGLWADATEGTSNLDRTELYQAQLARESFLGADEGAPSLDADALARLELAIAVRPAGKGDLKRFAELVNRTNQWNMTGARTTLARAREQQGAADALLLLAGARDRFGDMGDVCAASVALVDGTATIEAFVLSCRVFGYGVERTMLDAICDAARARGAVRVVGSFVPTTQNQMARDMYRDYGFAAEAEGRFVLEL